MIRYALKCGAGHAFESWFQSADAFDALAGAGHLTCPECGAHDVAKAVMAPDVRASKKQGEKPETQPVNEATDLAAFKARFEAESEYVGTRFAREARAIHEGTAPERPIYGEAGLKEAKALIEDGVKVAPLPFVPTRKSH